MRSNLGIGTISFYSLVDILFIYLFNGSHRMTKHNVIKGKMPLTGNSKSKGKVFPYSLPSVGPEADPGVQAVSPQVT